MRGMSTPDPSSGPQPTPPPSADPKAPARAHGGPLPPPAPGRPVRMRRPGPLPPGTTFVVAYADEEYPFRDGSWGRFGRDDLRCQIPVWEQVRGTSLSRVAGELWCAQGELWVRNVSTNHELTVVGSVGRPQTLPPRRPDERGWACTVPGRSAEISAPSTGEWVILARQVEPDLDGPGDAGGEPEAEAMTGPSTLAMALLPPALRPVAVELCAPMVLAGDPPATYDEIAARLDVSKRQARRYVDKLCDFYTDALRHHPETTTAGRPHYVPVAELLVGLRRVTREDVLRERARRERERVAAPPDPA